jgi:(E)-2-((N-methylformamido)methylene)succinate hydrolase
MVPGIEQRDLVVRDGTRIGYQVRPGSRPDAPWVVLANGLGGTFEAFRHLYKALAEYRVLCWDYRGLYTSGPSPDPVCNTVQHQVDDLLEICAHEGIAEAVHVGWSMGTQVNFELFKRAPRRVTGLMVVNGTYGRPFRTVLSSRFVHVIIPVLLRMVKAQADLVGSVSRAVAGSEALVNAMKRFGMVSDTLDMEAFRDVAAGFKTIDWRIYSDLLARLDEHDCEDVLPRIDVPTTIVTGDRDILTPPATAERMHREIPGSRLVLIRGGTHYTPVEFPAILQDELLRLLSRVPGWGRSERDAAAG